MVIIVIEWTLYSRIIYFVYNVRSNFRRLYIQNVNLDTLVKYLLMIV